MRTAIAFLLVIVSLPCVAQTDERLVIGHTDTLYSTILQERRRILVHVPHGNKDQRYPVLYILDGDDHFQSAVAIDEQLSGPLPEMIIIGITNTDRERDLTPTHVSPDSLINAGEAARAGGGDNFLKFIQQELFAYVDKHYPTAPYRVFSGHSLGGLAVMNAFFHHNDMFNAYIAIDPSVWWDQRRWIEQRQRMMSTMNMNGKGLFVAVANNLPGGMDTVSVFNDNSINTILTRSVLGLVKQLRATPPKGLRWSSKFYPNEWHGVVEFNAEYDALRYLFGFFRLDMRKIKDDPAANADSLLEDHYKKVSAILGYTVLPSEGNVNDLGYFFMGKGKMDQAYNLFKRNTINYPQSANAFDSLGDYYVEKGEKKQAINAFIKSLALQETDDTRRKLNALLK